MNWFDFVKNAPNPIRVGRKKLIASPTFYESKGSGTLYGWATGQAEVI